MDLITVKNTEVSFTNKELTKATNAIFKLGDAIKKNLYNVAYIMAKVEETECFKDDGFNNVHEWSVKTFGFKKSASYSLLKIGKEYTKEITTDNNGKVRVIGYGSNLVDNETEEDFTTTQIECMLPLGHETAELLVDTEEITPAMSCKEIKKIVKKWRDGDEPEETEETTEPEETEEETEPETTKERVWTNTQLDALENIITIMRTYNLSIEDVREYGDF